ncbi:MAG: proline dehydrogenase [Acidobacterium sp.]|nr:proline dehydrogenase [Acidobacteriota bacterium]PHY11915.1 MAG: proline dehydrogenase [Acidobacterium sp.]
MSIARTLLLKASDSAWLRENATKAPFVRRAVSRFMPGESFDDMIVAARTMAAEGVTALCTRLGENVKDLAEADGVARHYLEGIARIHTLNLACEPSLKLTQLGLDIDRELAYGHLRDLGARAHAAGNYLWIDMEQSHYVDITLDLTRRLRSEFPRVGVCLQAYLYRTREDLVELMARGVGIRLVKGAYNEPAEVAFPKKSDVDANYYALAQLMLAAGSRASGARAVFGTHDAQLIDSIRRHAAATGVTPAEFEIHMLYGIQKATQLRLARDGASVRVLIAYGAYWFPWYMRRLAERPANVWFVAKSLFG